MTVHIYSACLEKFKLSAFCKDIHSKVLTSNENTAEHLSVWHILEFVVHGHDICAETKFFNLAWFFCV